MIIKVAPTESLLPKWYRLPIFVFVCMHVFALYYINIGLRTVELLKVELLLLLLLLLLLI
jgi:uncharacterized membrane protein YoaK (UPF0700 family)